ncbi:hypothetical protein ACSFBX_25500 [Variovorax sp. RB2P76]|uniref:hypothetical protein n=1 Tax=Variovorax sp. RB2P76 TaxID=3443736 RepID=UPI003F46C3E0
MQEKWVEIIEKKYKDIKSPNYSFVLKEIEGKPCQKMIEAIAENFFVVEDTDENYDVSFGYILSASYEVKFLLRVSMVAPFALLARIKKDGFTSLPIVGNNASNSEEFKLIGIMESYGISLLDAETLEDVVLVAMNPTKTLYQWMFVDESGVPWQ